ncbi:MAG: hypothetical protein ACRD29_05125 [Acidimicrobiales bacterium]
MRRHGSATVYGTSGADHRRVAAAVYDTAGADHRSASPGRQSA